MPPAFPSFLLIHTYHPDFLRRVYRDHPDLAAQPFDLQRRRLFDTGYCLADAYGASLRALGCPAEEIIVNADPLQRCWAKEHGLTPEGNVHDRRRSIVEAQIRTLRPEVLYVFEWCPLGDAFLKDMRRYVRLLVGQVASPLVAGRTYEAYDLMLSSWPPLVEHFRRAGLRAEHFRLGFDQRVLDRLPDTEVDLPVSFVGGFAPSHPDRIAWLERLCREIELTVFGYGIETVPESSPLRRRHQGPVWGYEMYRVLRRSRVTLNRHAQIPVGGRVCAAFANNMRLYEATGVGTCLLTERRTNLPSLFEPDREVLTYADDAECLEKVRWALEHPEAAREIARRGQHRTLHEHTYRHRMIELLDRIRRHL